MGNQTLVPSQIQNVESYFNDLKTYIKFKSSLGSTTFMKTAKVIFIEKPNTINTQASTNVPNNLSISPNNTFNDTFNETKLDLMNTNDSLSNIQLILNEFNNLDQQLLHEKQHQIVAKIFPKYDLSIRLDLYGKRVREIKNIIYSRYAQSTNCLPYSNLIITDKAAYLFRQYIKYNLYDRLSTRPFLIDIEKKWIAFQLMCAVNEIHSLQIIHGDIKAENVLISSFLWVSLVDFASYKPVYLSQNHPSADFNYYFDTSRRRTCYLAPERFNPPSKSSNTSDYIGSSDSDLMQPPNSNDFKCSMDIFSLGCTIAELFMERPLFDFTHLLAYKEGKYDPKTELQNEINDKDIVQMILTMINIDAQERRTINEHLQEQNDKAFPSYFVFLKSYLSKFVNVKMQPDEIIIKLKADLPLLLKNLKLNLTDNNEMKQSQDQNTNDAFLILLSLLLSIIRKLKYAKTKLISIELMLNFSKFLNDSVILDRIIPYYLCLLDNQQLPIVKSKVIYALNECLAKIKHIDVQNLNIFPELIFESLEILSKDESYLVRATVARTIAQFALTSIHYLDTCFLTKRIYLNNGLLYDTMQLDDPLMPIPVNNTSNKYNEDISYDKEYQLYQTRVIDIVMNLIADTQYLNVSASNAVKEVLLRSNICGLCSFFGRQKTSEFLLPHMITILNEKNDWYVRAAFFDALCPVLTCIGWESIDMVKSLLEQGLKDSEEFVIHRTLLTLSNLVDIGLLDRQQIRSLLSDHVAPLLCHPSLWIRHGAVHFVSTICKQAIYRPVNNKQKPIDTMCSLSTADILSSIIPIISKYLTRTDLTQFERPEILLECIKNPLKRCIYDTVAQDGRSDHLFSFLTQRSEIRILTNQNYPPGYFDSPDPGIQQLFEKLSKLGLNEDDEENLLAMKDFMDKTRMSRLTSSLHAIELTNSNISGVITTAKSYSKENNILLKDGCISIMKDTKNASVVDLTLKQIPQRFVTSQESQNDEMLDSQYGQRIDDSVESESAQKRKLSRKSSQQLQQQQQQQQQQNDQNENCLNEFDGLLNRYKLFYEDYKFNLNRFKQSRDTINASLSSNVASFQTSKWKPKGYLIVHSNEHTKEITKLCRNYDSSFFATCSTSDSTVKLWSTDNLLDGKSGFFKSRFTYDRFGVDTNTSSRPVCMTFFDNTSLGVLNDDFRFFKIDFDSSKRQYRLFNDSKLFKSNFCKCVLNTRSPNGFINSNDKSIFYYLRKPLTRTCSKCDLIYSQPSAYPTDLIYLDQTSPTWPTATINNFDYYSGSYMRGLFVYASSSGYVSCIDMRTKSKVYDLKFDLRKGFVTCMATDPWCTWIAYGTSNGCIDIYDFRFMLPIQRFQHRSRTSVVRLSAHPFLKNHLIATYQGNNELAIWNIETNFNMKSTMSLLSSNVKSTPEFTFWGVQNVPPLCQKGISNEYISGIYGCTYDTQQQQPYGALICASTDMKIRYIDLNDSQRDSYLVSSPTNTPMQSLLKTGNDRSFAIPNVSYEMRLIEGSKVLVEADHQSTLTNTSGGSGITSNSLPHNSSALAYQNYCTHHQDSITDLIVCYKQQTNQAAANQAFLVTTSRDGTLKVWR